MTIDHAPDVSVCIVNWNGRAILRNCLVSLQDHDASLAMQVIVVDNASADDSLSMMHEEFPEVKVIANATNAGFATANNQAAAVATGRHLLFLNNDTVVEPGALERLVQYLDENANAAAVGPKLIGDDGQPQRSARNLPTLPAMLHWGVLPIRWSGIYAKAYRRYRNALDVDIAGPAPQLAAAAMLVRREAFDAIAGWDDAFPFGMEDVDFCLRLARVGAIHYLPDARVTHLGRASSHLARGPVYRGYQCGTARYFRKHHPSRLAPTAYKIGVTLDAPLRLTLFAAKAALSRLTGRREQATRSAERAAGVWFFITRGLGPFWRA